MGYRFRRNGGMDEWMKTQEILLHQRVQLQIQTADRQKQIAQQRAAESIANQPVISQADNLYHAQQHSQVLRQEYEYNKNMAGATMDSLAAGMIYPAANAVGQFSKGVVQHTYGIYQGIKEGDYWSAAKNAGLLALDVVPFIPFKGATGSVVLIKYSVRVLLQESLQKTLH